MITCRAAAPGDAALIAPLLRSADAREVRRLGMDPEAALRGSIERSECTGVFEADGLPLCAFGLERPSLLTPQIGAAWMLGTDLLNHHARDMLRETRRWVEAWQQSCTVIFALVDAEYPAAVRWMGWLGFVACSTETMITGAKFLRMERSG